MIRPDFALGVEVFNIDNTRLTNAVVSVENPIGSTEFQLNWSDVHQCFISNEISRTTIKIQVSCPGFETQSREGSLEKFGQKFVFVLGKVGSKYIYKSGVQIPLRDLDGLLGAAIGDVAGRVENREALINSIVAALGSLSGKFRIYFFGDFIHFLPVAPLTNAEVSETLSIVRNHEQVTHAGPVIGFNGVTTAISTNALIVTFKTGVLWSTAETVLNTIGAESYERLEYSRGSYLLRLPVTIGWEIFDTLTTVQQHASVLHCEILAVQEIPKHAINPTDFHWPSQWDKHIMGLSDAWQVLHDTISPEAQFGDATVLVAVVDNGIKSTAGEPDNIDFKGYVSDGVLASTTVQVDPPNGQLILSDANDFNAGDSITIGNETVTIINKVGNQLDVTTLFVKHFAKSEVVNNTNAGAVSFLTADAIASTNVFQVALVGAPAGPGGDFKPGHVLSFRGLTDNDWESVKILDVDPGGTQLTTTPVTKTHALGTTVTQGRKVYRLFDFEDTNFVPNNDNPEDAHGTSNAGVVASKANNDIPANPGVGEGTAGVAPNVRLMGLDSKTGDHIAGVRQFLWAVGAIKYISTGVGFGGNTVPLLYQAADVITTSLGFGEGGSNAMNADVIAGLSKAVRRGRNGRGIPAFFSAGNDNIAIDADRWCTHPMVMSVAASTLFYTPESHPGTGDDLHFEHKPGYSNFSNVSVNPNMQNAFCAPSNNNTGREHSQPAALRIYSADFAGSGNLINRSDASTLTTGTTIAVSTKLNGALPLNSVWVPVDSVAGFSDGDWIKLGDLRDEEWVEIKHVDVPGSQFELYATVSRQNQIAHDDNELVSLLPKPSRALRSIVPGSDDIYISLPSADSSLGYKANDWIRIGMPNGPVKWVQLASVDLANKKLTMMPAYIDPNVVQFYGVDSDKNALVQFNANMGDTEIEVNIAFSIVSSYFRNGQAIRITTSGGNQWTTIKSYESGTVVTGIPIVKLKLDNGLIAATNSGSAVFIPKRDKLSGYIIGSTVVDVVSTAAFSANSWVHITTPANIGNPITPRVESAHVQSVISATQMRISGPYFTHPVGTPIHTCANADFNDNFGGTSAATPQCGGAAALLLSVNPKLTWVEVRQFLRDHAIKLQPNTTGFQPPVPPDPETAYTTDVAGTRPQGVGRWMNQSGVFIRLNNGAFNPAAGGDHVPVYSDWFGYGRIDINASLTAAWLYTSDKRDLMIRDYLIMNPDGSAIQDDGTVETDATIHPIDSPDIWIRENYTAAGDAVPPGTLFGFSAFPAPPHQNALIGGDRSIYVRAINRGTDLDSLQAWVRVYFYLTDGIPDPSFPSYFDDTLGPTDGPSNYTTGKSGIYFYKELELFDINAGETIGTQPVLGMNGGIAPAHAYAVHTKWDQAIQPPLGTHKRTYVVAEILPYDGPLADLYVHRNSNISYKRIAFTEAKIFEDTVGNPPFPDTLEFNPASPIKNFKITVRDWEYMPQKHIQIRFKRSGLTGVEETSLYTYNGASWNLDQVLANYTINPPVITPGGVGQPDLYTFSGSVTLTATDSEVCFIVEVLEPQVAEEDHLNPVNALVVRSTKKQCIKLFTVPNLDGPADDLGPAKTPRIHVFADMAKLKPQTDQDQGFAPDFADPLLKFRVTSRFEGLVVGDTINAYAVATGRVFIQQADPLRVNLFIKPLEQSGIGFTPVKYFVYRGLKLTDFLAGAVSPANKQVRARPGASPFIEELYQIIDDRNNAQTPVGTDVLTSKAFGWDPDNQVDLQRTIDDYFYSAGTENDLQVVTKGTILGTFLNDTMGDEFGFEIILEDGTFVPNIAYSRVNNHAIEIPVMLGTYEDAILREQVLSFIDPTAYYGMHYFAGVEIPGNPPIDKMDLYNQILNPFYNKHILWLDVRNEFNYSYNYNRNYSAASPNEDRILLRATAVDNYLAFDYSTSKWPLHKVLNASIVQGDYGLGYYKLRLGDNDKPVLYLENASIITAKTNSRFIDSNLLLEAGNTFTTKAFGFVWPQVPTGGAFPNRFISTHIKLRYLRRLPTGVDVDNDVLKSESYLDNLFGPLEAILQTLEIDQTVQVDNKFILDGNYSASIKVGDIVKVEESAGNNGVYTVASVNFIAGTVQTEIVVNEPVPSGAVPLGTLTFSYHLWNVDLPTRWFSGYRRSFVDAIGAPLASNGVDPLFGFGFVANTGQAIDNGRVVFYAAPYHFMKRGNNSRAVNQVNLNGGTGESDSIWTEVIKQNPQLKISGTTLKIATSTYLPVFEFEQVDEADGNEKDENFLAICVTEVEMNQIKGAVFTSALSKFHNRYIKLKNPTTSTDLNAIEYIRYEIWITGWEHNPAGGGTVEYLEVSSQYTSSSPVYVYALASNPLIFSSSGFAILEPLEDEKTKSDEELRNDPVALNLLAADPTLNALLSTFQSDLNLLTDNLANISTLIDSFGEDLFNQAVSNSVAYDGRPIYWARLHASAAIKSHLWVKKQRKLSRSLIDSFEQFSRGFKTIDYTNANPAFSTINVTTAKKILIVGFDPPVLDPKSVGHIDADSTSSVLAYALHNAVITHLGNTGAVQSVIFPLRYNDYEKEHYLTFFNKYLQGVDQVDMILLLGDSANAERFDLDWVASKALDGSPDNVGSKKRRVSGVAQFIATTLPVNDMVISPAPAPPRIFFDQSYKSSSASELHPADGGIDNNIIPASLPVGKADEGSAGLFIYNMAFYRLLEARLATGSSTSAGMTSLPKPGAVWNSMATIQTEIEAAIKRALASI